MKILPYFCDEATNPGKQWLAHLDLGRDIYMSFFGANKDEAIERAERWYVGERAKHNSSDTNTPASAVPSSLAARELMPKDDWSNFNKENWVNPVDGVAGNWADAPVDALIGLPPSEHKLSGSVWVLNRSTGHRARIAANELGSYEERGYIKGGPRSK